MITSRTRKVHYFSPGGGIFSNGRAASQTTGRHAPHPPALCGRPPARAIVGPIEAIQPAEQPCGSRSLTAVKSLAIATISEAIRRQRFEFAVSRTI